MRDLDGSAVLDAVVERRRAADRAEADLLALAVHWVDLHPVTDEHPAATFPTQRSGGLAAALGPGFFARAPLAGDGTPGVAEYAVEELAARVRRFRGTSANAPARLNQRVSGIRPGHDPG